MIKFRHSILIVLIAYALIFSLYFYQLIAVNTLPGDMDSWLYIATYDSYLNAIQAWFANTENFVQNYPEGEVYKYLDPSFGGFLFYSFFKLMGFTSIKSLSLYTISYFTLNASGIFLVSKQLRTSTSGAFIAGLMFCFSNFVLCQLDNHNAIVFFPSLFSLYFLIRFKEHRKTIYLLLSVLFIVTQLYFSTYLFLFGLIASACYLLFKSCLLLDVRQYKKYLFTVLIGLFLVSPYFYIFIIHSSLPIEQTSILSRDLSEFLSLNLEDFGKYHFNNLLRPRENFNLSHLKEYWNAAGFGISGLIISILAFYCLSKSNFWLFFLGLIGLFLAFGPYITGSIPSPLQFLFHDNSFILKFKHINRAYLLFLFVLSIGSGKLWDKSCLQHPKIKLLAVALFLLFFAENTPLKLNDFKSYAYELNSIDDLAINHEKVYLFGRGNESIDKFDLNNPETRKMEYIYMYWQTIFRINTINGVGGFVPDNRIRNQNYFFQQEERENMLAPLPSHVLNSSIKNEATNYLYILNIE